MIRFGWSRPALLAVILTSLLGLGGCASFFQASDRALIRRPGNRTYDPPQEVAASAQELWVYAVLSENTYAPMVVTGGTDDGSGTVRPSQYDEACVPTPRVRIPLTGWRRWENFPPEEVRTKAKERGLHCEVWETTTRPQMVVVAFRGTEARDQQDWKANSRWFLRFVPFYTDEYVEVSQRVGQALVDRVKERLGDGTLDRDVRLVATGHSLGGGLAQHLAYSLPADGPGDAGLPRITRVYAFDPSPVTGWSTVPSALREANAQGLETTRAFEHGEILSYVRLLLSYVYPPAQANPAITEIRYNFISSDPVSSHSMRMMACALINASGTAPIPDVATRFLSE